MLTYQLETLQVARNSTIVVDRRFFGSQRACRLMPFAPAVAELGGLRIPFDCVLYYKTLASYYVQAPTSDPQTACID